MPTIQVIRPVLGFNPFTDAQLESLGNAIDTGLYAHPDVFSNPTFDHATFKAQFSSFSAAVIAAADGGKKAIAEKKKQRKAFCKMLRQLGHYVEAASKDEEATFLLSGYQPMSTVRTQKAAAVPHGITVNNGTAAQLVVRSKTGSNIASVDVRFGPSNTAPASWPIVSFTNGRSMVLTGLTPGTAYTVQVRALGSLGNSDWSDPVARICT